MHSGFLCWKHFSLSLLLLSSSADERVPSFSSSLFSFFWFLSIFTLTLTGSRENHQRRRRARPALQSIRQLCCSMPQATTSIRLFSFFFFFFLPFLESLLRNRKRERKKKEKSRREKARGTDVLHEGFGRRSPRVDQQLRRRLTSVFPNAMLWIRLLYWAPSFFFALLICPNGWRDFSVSFSFPQVILDRKKAAFLPHREPR